MYLIIGVLITVLTSHYAYIAQQAKDQRNLVDQKLLLKYTYTEASTGEEKTITFVPYSEETKNGEPIMFQKSKAIAECTMSCIILVALSVAALKLVLFALSDTLINLFENRVEILGEEGQEEGDGGID